MLRLASGIVAGGPGKTTGTNFSGSVGLNSSGAAVVIVRRVKGGGVGCAAARGATLVELLPKPKNAHQRNTIAINPNAPARITLLRSFGFRISVDCILFDQLTSAPIAVA